ncbi:aminodeoxychorismate synthase component I [Salipiger mangrovisoli]|uniref:Aminodeoxychorismate synthase component I n=1 Tax=Salipiger mangrovisoli TaxID=2865933 RepID=A0ABR9X8J1_9RHOB|nr:aminodeoxychorismate synthase component I [Salipiger mangrovisoli]MBE9639746.1 aminodeoxychorismate synthase component I [Salipiger mangrovisoli]
MQDTRIILEAGPSGAPVLFARPRALVTASSPAEALLALARLEEARAQGFWVAGYAAYELGSALEPALAQLWEPGAPLLHFGIFDAPSDASAALAEMAGAPARVTAVTPLWSRERYAEAFREIKEMLAAGDLYQVNLTMPVEACFEGTPEALWAALRAYQPVGHGGFARLGQEVVLSRSPELFFRLDADGRIEVAPMKGTAPRGASAAEDDALSAALAADEKNRAENVMIVDLMRNDLSRLARPGSVKVPELLKVERYATVHQMVSRVVAELDGRPSLTELLRAIFPCGSITGAPKIAAMKAIHHLERWRRGVYCGGLGWMAPNGAAEFNVAIRTLSVTGAGRAVLGVGGGIVQDSICEAEYEEALWKARFLTGLMQRG